MITMRREMALKTILIVRKMSPLEYYYKGQHKSKELVESSKEQVENMKLIEETLKGKCNYKIITRRELSEDLVDSYDYVISAGGDGTVIAVAAYNKSTPQLNLKLDKRSRGNLCQENIKESLKSILDSTYVLEKWSRQEVHIDEKLVGRALNEVCIGEDMNFSKMSRYNLSYDSKGKSVKEYHANSGIIIVTGTGSTGWPSTFKKYHKDKDFFKFRTILPVEGSEKGEGSNFDILYKGHEGTVALDTVGTKLPRDSLLKIRLSKYPLKIIIAK